jgi:phospholipase C
VLTNGDDGARAMGYYDESDLPYYYALARTFALSDAHFASVMGPTMPNRLTYFAGTSFGQIQNSIPPLEDSGGHSFPNVFSRLDEVNTGWRVYTTNTGTPAVFISLLQKHLDRFQPLDQFFTDLGQGNLAPVSVVEAGYGEGIANDEDDEHAESNIQLGQQFVARVVNAVMASGSWPHAAVFLSYDEHGGFYDHVPPPPACKPDELEPIGDTKGRHFDRYGFRVPLMVISPYARRAYLSHTVSDHTSILRFLAARFGFKALTARDANADPLLEMFDFDHPDLSVPMLPEAVVDDARVAQCKADFPTSGM